MAQYDRQMLDTYRETKEEARIIVKDLFHIGNYLRMMNTPHKWVKEKIPKKGLFDFTKKPISNIDETKVDEGNKVKYNYFSKLKKYEILKFFQLEKYR